MHQMGNGERAMDAHGLTEQKRLMPMLPLEGLIQTPIKGRAVAQNQTFQKVKLAKSTIVPMEKFFVRVLTVWSVSLTLYQR